MKRRLFIVGFCLLLSFLAIKVKNVSENRLDYLVYSQLESIAQDETSARTKYCYDNTGYTTGVDIKCQNDGNKMYPCPQATSFFIGKSDRCWDN